MKTKLNLPLVKAVKHGDVRTDELAAVLLCILQYTNRFHVFYEYLLMA